jgi:hypothetical protein
MDHLSLLKVLSCIKYGQIYKSVVCFRCVTRFGYEGRTGVLALILTFLDDAKTSLGNNLLHAFLLQQAAAAAQPFLGFVHILHLQDMVI